MWLFTILRRIFAYIPGWLGGYNGISNTHICAEMTGVPVHHWEKSPKVCDDLLDQHIISSGVGVAFLTLAWWIIALNYYMVKCCVQRITKTQVVAVEDHRMGQSHHQVLHDLS